MNFYFNEEKDQLLGIHGILHRRHGNCYNTKVVYLPNYNHHVSMISVNILVLKQKMISGPSEVAIQNKWIKDLKYTTANT